MASNLEGQLDLERRQAMKRLILGLAAAAALAGPMAAAGAAHAQTWDRQGRGDHRDWSRDNDRGSRSQWDNDRGRRDRNSRPDWDRGWDRERNNGYYYNNRWSYGPPPPAYYNNPSYRPGYSSWRRGSVLPPYYRGYVVSDYSRYHLRPPPRGYAWYQAGDDYLLAAIASGLIFEIIADN
jgi:Ni/Co efflux regulator RcnB